MKRVALLSAVSAAAILVSMRPSLADSITPSTFTGSVGVGGTISITDKTVVVSAGPATSSQADVLFVVDTTGSMGPAITALQSELSTVASDLSSYGNIDIGAAQYKDKTSDGYDPFDYSLTQDITSSVSSVESAIDSWSAGGGGDNPEQGLYALSQAATTTTWRPGSKKIVVIIGDAPAHSSPTHPPAAGGVDVSNVTTTLEADGVTMVALNVGSAADGDPGLGGDTSNGLNAYGQFSGVGSLLGDGVPGSYDDAIPSAADLASDIEEAVGTALATYDDVSLDLVGTAPSCVSVTLPSDITGDFNRGTSNTFDFGAVSFTGTNAGTCSFTIAAEVDGSVIAEETDTVTVGAVPEPASLALFGSGLIGAFFARRRKKGKARRA